MPGPLDGVRVIDLTAIISGPVATQILGDQGADVIKVEPQMIGDMARHLGPQINGVGGMFAVANRSKRSVALNLKSEEGKRVLLDLAKDADVFVQNFRPGAVERMGVDYEAVRAINPEVVYVSISGFGQDGPNSNQRVYDSIIQASSGFCDMQADQETGAPRLIQGIECDKITALTVSQAITAALFARAQGEGGQHVLVNMLDSAVAFLWADAMYNLTFLEEHEKVADFSDFYSLQETADGWVTFVALSDSEFHGVCRAMGRADLIDDARFQTTADRVNNVEVLRGEQLAAMNAMKTDELVKRMHDEDVPCAKVNLRTDLFDDPQIVHNGAIQEVTHPHAGRMRQPKPAADFARTPSSADRPAPLLGEQTEEILSEIGYSPKRLAKLKSAGVVG
jgi:crotonobetainyl-CoA:carnitine CoA-transferase CaiB-like acyl-CoA transferase